MSPLKQGEAVRRDVLIGVLVKGTKLLRVQMKRVSARWSLTRVLLVASCSPLGRGLQGRLGAARWQPRVSKAGSSIAERSWEPEKRPESPGGG